MKFFTGISQQVDDLRSLLGDPATPDQLGSAVAKLDDDDVVAVITQTTAAIRALENLRIVASGVAGARSTRERGHGGLVQKRGHRNAASLIQEITGESKADAAKTVRLGESMLETAAADPSGDERPENTDADRPARPWHAALTAAQLAGEISGTQHDVIRRNLGEPPTVGLDVVVCTCEPATEQCSTCVGRANAAAVEAWATAAEQLIAEGDQRTVEELASAARAIRDLLDAEGAQRRFDEQFERRSFRVWTDREGVRRGSIVFDPHAGSWIIALINAAMRPRTGGPRFVDAEEKVRAKQLEDDPRTNDQLVYDLIIDTLRAGSLADAKDVFGTRQAGIRVITTADTLEKVNAGVPAVAVVEDDLTTVPGWMALMQSGGKPACSPPSRKSPSPRGTADAGDRGAIDPHPCAKRTTSITAPTAEKPTLIGVFFCADSTTWRCTTKDGESRAKDSATSYCIRRPARASR